MYIGHILYILICKCLYIYNSLQGWGRLAYWSRWCLCWLLTRNSSTRIITTFWLAEISCFCVYNLYNNIFICGSRITPLLSSSFKRVKSTSFLDPLAMMIHAFEPVMCCCDAFISCFLLTNDTLFKISYVTFTCIWMVRFHTCVTKIHLWVNKHTSIFFKPMLYNKYIEGSWRKYINTLSISCTNSLINLKKLGLLIIIYVVNLR